MRLFGSQNNGQGLPLKVIVIAIILVTVLIVVILFFIREYSENSERLDEIGTSSIEDFIGGGYADREESEKGSSERFETYRTKSGRVVYVFTLEEK